MMVPAGKAVDAVIDDLRPHLAAGRSPDRRRQLLLRGYAAADQGSWRGAGILYIGTGVSGGEEGALRGPAIMPGGQSRGLAAGQADLPEDRRQGRRRRPLLRVDRARTARAISSRWSTTGSSTATCR